MRICIFGAGAIGGHLAVRLALVGHEVSVVARGPHLDAIRRRGLVLLTGDERLTARLPAAADASELGTQDFVIVTVKATALEGLAEPIKSVLGEQSAVVFAQNGIPWWYLIGLQDSTAPCVDLSWMDRGGGLASLGDRVIGGVVFSAGEVTEPGVVRNTSLSRNQLIVGEPTDEDSQRVKRLREILEQAGFSSPATDSIRNAVWSKLIMNMTGSVLCCMMETSLRELRQEPAASRLLDRLRGEALSIARAYCPDLEYVAPTSLGSGHKPSLLQDYERRRPMEIDALIAAPLEFARAAALATPSLDLLAMLIADKARRAGLYSPERPLRV